MEEREPRGMEIEEKRVENREGTCEGTMEIIFLPYFSIFIQFLFSLPNQPLLSLSRFEPKKGKWREKEYTTGSS